MTKEEKKWFKLECGEMAMENACFPLLSILEETDTQPWKSLSCQSPHHPGQISNFSLPSAAFRTGPKTKDQLQFSFF